MKLIRIVTIAILASWWLTSCSPVYYAPNTHNVPLMKEKGELALNASTGPNIQFSYAAQKNIGIMLNHMSRSSSSSTNSIVKGQMTELGLGYYEGYKNHFLYEFYALAGSGEFDNKFETSGWLKGDVNKYAIQGNVGFRWKYFEMALSLKPTLIHFSNISGNLTIDRINQREMLSLENSKSFLEYATTIKFGFENIKIQAQMGSSTLSGRTPISRASNYLSLGVVLHFNAIDPK